MNALVTWDLVRSVDPTIFCCVKSKHLLRIRTSCRTILQNDFMNFKVILILKNMGLNLAFMAEA